MKTGIYWQDPKYALKPGRGFIFDPSLVLYLPLHRLDGASFMSKDAYGHLCTVFGALWRPNGHYFDGSDDNIVIPDSGSLEGFSQVTFLLWVKLAGDISSIVAELAKGGCYRFAHGAGTNEIWFQYGTSDAPWANNLISGYNLTTAWTLISIAYDKDAGANNMQFYINDFLQAQKTETGSILTSAGDLIIAADSPPTQRWFNGLIGEVLIYNRALSAGEIQRNYLATKWRYQ